MSDVDHARRSMPEMIKSLQYGELFVAVVAFVVQGQSSLLNRLAGEGWNL